MEIFNIYNNNFTKEAKTKRKRIRDRGINWKEHYTKRSLPLKKRFDKSIGDHSYIRWEGHDYTTNSDYYVVVGPSVQRGYGKMFFAGIKKLPPAYLRDEKKIYSPYGKYFPNIISAISYAVQRWGIRFPQGQPKYTKEDLANVYVPEHIKA